MNSLTNGIAALGRATKGKEFILLKTILTQIQLEQLMLMLLDI